MHNCFLYFSSKSKRKCKVSKKLVFILCLLGLAWIIFWLHFTPYQLHRLLGTLLKQLFITSGIYLLLWA